MKPFLTLIWIIISAIVLIYGHSYWKERTAVHVVDTSKVAVPAAVQKSPKPKQRTNVDGILAKAKNWPAKARTQFQQSLQDNKPYKVLFVGSKALGSQDQGMMKAVAQQLTAAYGSHIEISIHTYDTTSKQFLADKDELEIAAEKAQLIVLEPFLLNNNGNVEISESLSNLTTIIESVKTTDPDAVFILQPSFPLYDAVHYPVQVAQLKQYARQHQITYLDHWTAWPDTNSTDLKNDLLPDESAPNDQGNQVWSQYLIHYFISQ